jgi:parallel beta-helix repeat protein
MKATSLCLSLPLLILSLGVKTALVGAAGPGPLDPATAPAAGLFKTLDQVEPRTPIYSLPFSISQPGSYYLTGNLTAAGPNVNGITITASDVTLDLSGFALSGQGGTTGDGVNVSVSVTNVTVRNGVLRGWGGRGVDADTAFNSQLADLRSSNNGGDGMSLGPGGIIMGCTATVNGGDGIEALSLCTVSGCTATRNAGNGITASAGSTVADCSVSGNGLDGILASTGTTIRGNTAYTNVGDGIQVTSDCQVVDNTCDGNGFGAATAGGLHLTSANNRVERNSSTGNDRGLDIDAANNFVADNSVRGNTDNYDIAAGNQLRLILSQIPESIDWPATVVLAGALTGVNAQHGVTIAANDVTLDLAGHALIGVAGSLDGVSVSGSRTNVVIRNGTVRSWGSDGVQANTVFNGQFIDLRVSNNGASGLQGGNGGLIKSCSARTNRADGIVAATGCIISECTSSENGSDGITASLGSTVSACTSYNNLADGIVASSGSAVINCSAYSNTNGITASSGSTVVDCSARFNSTNGIVAASGSTISGCTASQNLTGINAASDCQIVKNTCHGNARAGILVTSSDNRIDSNQVSDNGIGIDCDPATGNVIVRNTASGNTTAYSIAAGNASGGVSATPATAGAWANLSF